MSVRFIDAHHSRLLLTTLILLTGRLSPAPLRAEEATEAAYLKVVTERADKILAPLNIDDDARRVRVRDLIAQQYVTLSKYQADVEAHRKAAPEQAPSDAKKNSVLSAIKQETDPELFVLHRTFVARLGAELSPAQVDQVKDGVTYGVVPSTYRHYLELLPDLTAEQKSVVLANLLEAREYAMDAGSSEKKHAWFDKFKGRINNFLSSKGYNLKQAERDWQSKRQQKTVAN
jgi:hypothetical protein